MQRFDSVQNVLISFFLLRLDALTEKFLSLFIEDDAFNLRAAEVYADAIHYFTGESV